MRFSLVSYRALSLSGTALALGLLSALGCASGKQYEAKTFALEGALRYKEGKEGKDILDAGDLAGGTLELESSTKEIIKFPIASDGTFTRDEKLPPGNYRARVIPPPPKADADFNMDAKYQKFESSGLTVTINDETPQRPVILLTRTQKPNRS
jgi:hypothetical protein